YLSPTPNPYPLTPTLIVRAKKSLGQNFLVDEAVVARIVREFEPRAGETVVEIGSGRGALTARLVGEVGRLVAVEFDRELIPVLRERFGLRENFKLVGDDALGVDFCAEIAPAARARVVANLPYNISTAILQKLIAQRACLTELVLMMQREVVERITAPPGSHERGYLSVLAEYYCESEKLFDVAPTAFRPVPKVWSTVVRLSLRERPAAAVRDETLLWQLVGAGFAQRRKTILNNLRAAPEHLCSRIETLGGAVGALEAAGVEPRRRAETLSLGEWTKLTGIIQGAGQ
ncbi:MAG: 16S rRNA (adenine(1518)-N(6)/adenine(1519)-N(6))-dimethyltransferase RsmA, partial [Pyrinomonadaceae bacterium]